MITSNQVSALMAQNQQQQMMLGMGAPSAVVGQSQYPPQFNFGQNPYIMGGGNLSGGSGVGSMISSGVAGVGSALGVGALAAGFMPASIAGPTIGGLAGSLLGLNPLTMGLMAGAAGVGMVGNAMNTGIRTNAQVGQMLSAANFANPNAPGGFGFSFNDQTRMSSQIIGMGASNPFVGHQDQMQLLNQFQQMGLDKGVTSMGKMIEKFKEFSKTTEDVATQLGKTVTEVTGLVQNLRGSGFYSASEVTGMSQRMSASAAYGINMQAQQAQMTSMANRARSMGMTGASGATLGVNLAQAFGSANQLGIIDENSLLDMTGTTNTADAAQTMSAVLSGRLSSAVTQGGVMEGLLAGFSSVDSSGNISIDQAAVNNMAGGRMSFEQLRRRTSDVVGGKDKAKFETNKRRLASEFLQSEQGMGAVLSTFRGMASTRAQSDDLTEEEAFKLILREYNIADERQAELLFDITENLDRVTSNNLKNRASQIAMEKRRAFLSKHRSFAGLKAKIGNEVGKITNNPYIARQTAKASAGFDAGIDAMERAIFGIEDSTAGLFTEQSTGQFRDMFLSGELEGVLGSGALGGGAMTAQDRFMSRLSGRVGNLRDFEGFQTFLTKGMRDDLKGITLDTSNFEYHTSYAGAEGRDADSIFTNYTGAMIGGTADLFSMLSPGGAAAVQARGGLSASFSADDTRLYNDLMRQAKAAGAETDEEAMAVIAQQSPKAAAALQRYLKRKGDFSKSDITNRLKDSYMSQATGNAIFSDGVDVAGYSAVTTAAGLTGAVLAGAKVGSVGGVLGALGGAAIGGIYGFMKYGDEKEFQKSLKGGAGNLLGKLNTKGKLKEFDKIFQTEMLAAGNDREAALVATASKLSDKYGETFGTEDVANALKGLYRASGKKTYDDRLENDDYDKALAMTKSAHGYQMAELAKEHLGALRDEIAGEDDEGLAALQEALSGGGDTIIGESRAAMADLALKAARGEYVYQGDNETLKTLAGQGVADLASSLKKQFIGQDVSALDRQYGKGAGQRLRELAGVRKYGDLTAQELEVMTATLAQSDSFRMVEGVASQGGADAMGGSDADVMNATKSLVTSTKKLAVYVDNIASVLTGNETAGQKIPGMDDIAEKR